jgi:hypothetical protein
LSFIFSYLDAAIPSPAVGVPSGWHHEAASGARPMCLMDAQSVPFGLVPPATAFLTQSHDLNPTFNTTQGVQSIRQKRLLSEGGEALMCG